MGERSKQMAGKILKVGVVGCGYIAQTAHIPALLKNKNCILVAVCDTNEKAASSVAKKFGIKRFYVDLAGMLAKEKPDIVDICTSINTHAPLAIQAMKAGCHVLVEKPLGINVAETTAMLRVSEESGVTLGVVHDMLFILAILKMKNIVQSGGVGKILGVSIKHSFPRVYAPIIQDPNHWWHRLPGGVFGDTLPHPIYLIREFLGNVEPVVVHTNKIGPLPHQPFDEMQIILESENGPGSIITSSNWPAIMTIDIFGTKMNLHGDIYNGTVLKIRERESLMSRAFENIYQCFEILGNSVSNGLKILTGNYGGHKLLIDDFVNNIKIGRAPTVTAQDGKAIVSTLAKITSMVNHPVTE